MRSKQKKFKVSKGEISERLLERQDLSILEASVSYFKNFISTPFGSFRTRAGSKNIDKVANVLDEIPQPVITSYAGEFTEGIPVPDELVAYWKLDEAIGNAIDSFSSYDVVETGTVPSTTGVLDGARGQYTTSNYFKWAASGSSTTVFDKAQFMVDGWFKTSAVGDNHIIEKGDVGTTGWDINTAATGKLRFLLNGINTSTVATINDDDWHYFVCMLYGTGTNETRIYIDGVLDTEYTSSGFTASTFDFYLGTANNTGAGVVGPFIGELDDMSYLDLTSTSKSIADIEDEIITLRWNDGAGKAYAA